MILALESDGYIAWINDNLDVFQTFSLMQIDLCHNAERGDNLVGYVLHQSFAVGHAYHLMVVIHTDINSAALCVGETTNPFEVFVTPRLLVLDVLLFFECYLCHYVPCIMFYDAKVIKTR